MNKPPLFEFPWPAPVREGVLVRRYDRFLIDAIVEGIGTVVAHCVNPGSMEGLVVPGARVWLTPATTTNRKLRWTWSLTERDGVMVGADTSLPNRLVRAMLEARALPGVRRWRELHPEHAHAPGNRVDFRLIVAGAPHDIEVKNCHLVYPDGRAYFPDSVSERATRHLQVLAREVRRGVRATVLFVVQRPDPVAVRPSAVHDPAFAEAARCAAKAGVRFRALRVHATPATVQVLGELPVDLERYDLEPVKRWREGERTRSGWLRSARKG